MKAREMVIERVSSVLYHATGFLGAYKILESDYIKGPEISFTRSLQGAYHKRNKIIGVIFEFDGDKLNHNYKGRPVGTENFMYDPDDYDPADTSTHEFRGRENAQLEDRIYAKNGITDATKYITKAIIYVPTEYLDKKRNEFGDEYSGDIELIKDVFGALEEYPHIEVRILAAEKDLVNRGLDDKEGLIRSLTKLHKSGDLGSKTRKWAGIGNKFEIDFILSRYPDGDFDEAPTIEHITRTITASDEDKAYKEAAEFATKNTKADDFYYVDLNKITDLTTGEIVHQE